MYDRIRYFEEGGESLEDNQGYCRTAISATNEKIDSQSAGDSRNSRHARSFFAFRAEGGLGRSRLRARWVTRTSRLDQKTLRVHCCVSSLNEFDGDPGSFVGRVVRGYETWIYKVPL